MRKEVGAVASDRIETLITFIRGKRVILDSDLARLYGVTTTRLNEQVKRNPNRFPPDFMFPLSQQEVTNLISQNATSRFWGGRRKPPNVFTEHGAIMAANVLNSGRAVDVSVYVVRAFVRLRELAMASQEVGQKLAELERRVVGHDEAIRSLVQTIRQLMAEPRASSSGPPEKPRRSIGFTPSVSRRFKVEEPRPRYGRPRRRGKS
jgi:hypothetical protein